MADEQNNEPTTAQLLGWFHKELTAEGLDVDTVKYLVQCAGREMVVGGLSLARGVSCDG